MFNDNQIKVQCDRNEVITILRQNLAKHEVIVQEARRGYVEKAKKALEAKLDALNSGKVEPLTFALPVPEDYTRAYQTAIRLLEMHTEKTIELDATNAECFIMDRWSWRGAFLMKSAAYSATAAVASRSIDPNENY